MDFFDWFCEKIVWIFWDLEPVLFHSPKDVVFTKKLPFGNVLHFPGVNLSQIWTKNVHFQYVPLLLKYKILKDCWSNFFDVWETTSGKNIHQNWAVSGGERTHKLPKRGNLMDTPSPRNIWTFITWEPQMLYRWNLPRLCIFMRPFIWHKNWGASQRA